MKVGVLVFPGSNCDADTRWAFEELLGQPCRMLWHKEGSIGDCELVVVPGGFSYGDYLRTGAIARFSPIMKDVIRHGAAGGLVLGICNGFQILTEAGMLPGALLTNNGLRFLCRDVNLRVEHDRSVFTRACTPGQRLTLPIAHHGGRYFADDNTLAELEAHDQVLFRYCDSQGRVTDDSNPNGSCNHIAGVQNRAGNVAGLMPHPERNAETVLGNGEGRRLLESVTGALLGA